MNKYTLGNDDGRMLLNKTRVNPFPKSARWLQTQRNNKCDCYPHRFVEGPPWMMETRARLPALAYGERMHNPTRALAVGANIGRM